MSTKIDQKAYLQKYLGGPSGDKKKKKKKVSKGKGFKIIDDDIDLTKLRALEGDELDILGEGEDAPQIAGIIDERPEEVRKLEQFKTSSKWRVINQDDGFNSKLQIEEIKRDIKEVEKENEVVFGKMYSDSEDEKKNDSDISPPRKKEASEIAKNTSKKSQNNSDSDFSPPRRNEHSKPSDNKHKSEVSPRKHENQRPKDRIRKPSRWGDTEEPESKTRQRSPSDSPRRSKKQRTSQSPARKSKRKSSGSNSPPRKSQKVKQKNYDSDMSPPRKSRKDSSKKRNLSSDSDLSPPRKRKQSPNTINRIDKYDTSKDKRKSWKDSDSDLSPPRKNKSHNERRKSSSPQRKSRKHSTEGNQSKRKHDSDSDLSPPRKQKNREGREQRNNDDNRSKYKRSSNSPPPTNRKMARTLEGKMAGLQDAKQLRQENEAFRRREEDVFNKMTDEVSGRNAQAVSRKAKRETSEDREKLKEKAERQKELDEKYKKWSKGLKQIEAQEARVQDYLHEASKPLARHRDDKDLENRLRDVERAGDPMLKYMREKKRERGELAPERPTYKGGFPPNRFNIRPGYRWDGVDRSNGYEKKYFEQQSKRKAMQEEAYRWSTEDL